MLNIAEKRHQCQPWKTRFLEGFAQDRNFWSFVIVNAATRYLKTSIWELGLAEEE